MIALTTKLEKYYFVFVCFFFPFFLSVIVVVFPCIWQIAMHNLSIDKSKRYVLQRTIVAFV